MRVLIVLVLNRLPLRVRLLDLFHPTPSATSGDGRVSVVNRRRTPDRAGTGNLGRYQPRREAIVDHAISNDGQADDHLHRGRHLVTLIAPFAVILEGAGLLPSRLAVVLEP